MATESYEESLSAEGIPVITKRRLSRDGVDDGLGVLPLPPTRGNPVKSRTYGQVAALAKAREAEVEQTGRDRGVRGSVAPASWEQNAHAHDSRP
jgi:hypothetical protein